MSGILDSKKRIIDIILTLEGRRQVAFGDLKIESYTFTDMGVLYGADISSGSIDATSKIYFEAASLPQDSITFESNEDGRLISFKNGEGLQVSDGQLVNYEINTSTGASDMSILNGVSFEQSASLLLEQTLENFKKLRTISNKDDLFDTQGFGVGNSEIEFLINDTKPIQDRTMWSANINLEESLFNDPRMCNVLNFRYLPPINKTDENIDKTNHHETKLFQLGTFSSLGKSNIETITYKQLKSELSYFDDIGYSQIIKFDPTTKYNNLLIQFFEKGFNQLSKLDVFEFGKFKTDDSKYPFAHVFFAGKLLTDNNDSHTFIHLFTLVFEG